MTLSNPGNSGPGSEERNCHCGSSAVNRHHLSVNTFPVPRRLVAVFRGLLSSPSRHGTVVPFTGTGWWVRRQHLGPVMGGGSSSEAAQGEPGRCDAACQPRACEGAAHLHCEAIALVDLQGDLAAAEDKAEFAVMPPLNRVAQRLTRLMPARQVDQTLMKDIFLAYMKDATAEKGVPVQLVDHDGRFAEGAAGALPVDMKPFPCIYRIDIEREMLCFFRGSALLDPTAVL